MKIIFTLGSIAIALLFISGASYADMEMGSQKAKTTATGSAGGETSQNANSQLERCPASLGTLAVVEDTDAEWYHRLSRDMKLGPTTPVLKLLVQQSNCFVVVERGKARKI